MIVNLPKLGLVEFNDSLSPQEFHSQLTQLADKYDFEIPGPDKHGMVNAFKAGLQGWWGSAESGLGEMLGSEGLKQRGAANAAEAEAAYAPTSEKDVSRAFDRGILPGLGAAFEHYVGEPVSGGLARYAAPMVGGAAAAALAPLALPEVAAGAGIAETLAAANTAARVKNVASVAGFGAADLPSNVGENVAYQQQVNPGQPVDTGAAIAAGIGQTALDRFGIPVAGFIPKGIRGAFGSTVKDLTEQVGKGAISHEAAVDALGSKFAPYLKSIGSNYAGLASMGLGDEALRRAQAGQDVMSPEAVQSYKEQLAGGIAPALLFGAGHEFVSGTHAKNVQAIDAAHSKYLEEQQKAAAEAPQFAEGPAGTQGELFPTAPVPPEAHGPAAFTEPTTISHEALAQTGLPPEAGLFKQLVGKDLANPKHADAVARTLAAVRNNGLIPGNVKQAVHDLAGSRLYNVNQKEMFGPRGGVTPEALQGDSRGTPRTAPNVEASGERVPVPSGTEPLGATPGLESPEARGVVPPAAAPDRVGAREGDVNAPVEPGTQGELFPEAAGPRAGIEAEEPTTAIPSGQGEMFGPRGGVTKEALQKPAKPSAKIEPEKAETPVPTEEQAPATSAEMPTEEAPAEKLPEEPAPEAAPTGPGDHLRPIIDAAMDRGAIELDDASRMYNLLDSGRPEDIAQVQAELAGAARRSKAARLEELPPKAKEDTLDAQTKQDMKEGRGADYEGYEQVAPYGSSLRDAAEKVPSVKRAVGTALRRFESGKLNAEQTVEHISEAHKAAQEAESRKEYKGRTRGADYVRQRLLEAKRRGEISAEGADLADWFLSKNPHLAEELGISIRETKQGGVSGTYNPSARIVTLFKGSERSNTAIHEIMHHLERMMPEPIRAAITKEWVRSTLAAYKKAKAENNAAAIQFYKNVMGYHTGNGGEAVMKAATDALKDGAVDISAYQHTSPSEFWAENAARIMQGKFNVPDTVLGRLKQWLGDLGQKVKSLFGMQSDAPVLAALDSLQKGDGKFVTDRMLQEGQSKYQQVSTVEPLNKDLDNYVATAPSNISKLPPVLQGPVRAITQTFFAKIKDKSLGLLLTEDVAQLAKKYMKSVANYIQANQLKRETIRDFETRVSALRPMFEALPDAIKREVNRFIGESTFNKQWGYDPGIPGVTVDPASPMAMRFNALPKEARDVIQGVFEHGQRALEAKKAAITEYIDSLYADKLANATDFEKEAIQKQKDETRKKFETVLNLKTVDPYAPLKRFGEYVVVGKSKEYWEAEKNADWKEVAKLREGGDHYHVEFADTMGEANAIKDKLAATGKFSIEEPFKRSEARDKIYAGPGMHMAFAELRRKLDLAKDDETLDASARKMHDALDNIVQDLYLTSLADFSARKSEITRKRIAGYDQDMMRAFFTQGMADARFIGNLKHNSTILDALSNMATEAKTNRAKANPYLNEFMAREAQNMQIRSPSMLDGINRLVGDWYLTFSPSFYLQQSLQTYTFSLPWMAARFGYFKSNKALMKSYGEIIKLLNKTKIADNIDLKNLPESITPQERAMLDHLVSTGIIDVGVETTLHGFRSETGPLSAYAKTTNTLRSGINKIEVLNRATTALATFRLAMEHTKGDAAAAQAHAYDAVRVTHGSYDGFNTPRLFNSGPVARSVTQFRRFQIIQLTMLAKQMHSAFKGATPEERAVGRKELMFLMGHTMALGGAKGLPYWAVGSAAYTIINSIFGNDEDQPKDFEAWLREHGGLLLTKGIPAAMGVDVSGKLGMGNVLSVAPFTETDLSSATGYEKTAMGFAGPFAGGLMPNMADGVGLMAQGDYYKGLEKFMPNVVANSMKGYRFVTDGVTNKTGDLLMSPEDVKWTDGLMQSVGLPTTNLTERSYRAEEMYKTNQFFQNTQKNLAHKYEQSFKNGDADGMQEARQEFLQLQNARAAHGFTRLPLTTLTKDVEAQRKRERAVVGGVEATKQNIEFARELEDQTK